MMMNIEYTKDSALILVDELMPLRWVGHGMEGAMLWFLGREVWAVECHRAPYDLKRYAFILGPVGPANLGQHTLKWSNYTSLATLAVAFPSRLTHPFKTIPESTVIGFHNWKSDSTLGMLAYAFVDMALDLFMRGAKTVRTQFSRERSEACADIGMDHQQALDLMNPHTRNYEVGDYVGRLPWSK